MGVRTARTVVLVPLIAGLAVLWFTVIAWATRDGRDAANDGRSIDKYSNAMRVLSRRAPARHAASQAGGRYIVTPGTRVTDPARTRTTALDRRRTMLRRLVIASGVSFAGLLLGGPWVWIHLTIDAGLVGYVVFLRRSTLAAAEAARAQRRVALAEREAAHRAAYDAAHGATATVLSMPEPDERRRAVND
ncbi:MAG: hypothetical protein QOE45_155 [Frankiaceae bacterium]|jgi:hypothetical protein|nr:hypothetical protein [Frankiaceae bacterium]